MPKRCSKEQVWQILLKKHMDKTKMKESIGRVEESIKISRENKANAEHHIEEGEIILEALKAKL